MDQARRGHPRKVMSDLSILSIVITHPVNHGPANYFDLKKSVRVELI